VELTIGIEQQRYFGRVVESACLPGTIIDNPYRSFTGEISLPLTVPTS